MPPVVAVVGYSDAGKTRVVAALVEALTHQGFRVAAVKHCPHGHEADRLGSDTDRLSKAGAVTVVASSPGRLTKIEQVNGDSPLETIVSAIGCGADIVIAEGFKSSAVPKVLVGSSPPPVENVIAHVSGKPKSWDLPTYTFDELDGLAGQIRRQFLQAAPS